MPGEPHYPAKILYFPSMHLRLHVKPSIVLDVTPYHERKMQALACYHSQFIAGRLTTPPTFFDDVIARARYFGWTIGALFGEPFISREEVGLRDLRHLV
jgi:LmbE family N-acetylglucosaminyl deacetylase